MGQQQLLLVILVTIIVGIATVVAINTFSSAADSANVDAVRNDVASIAASAQGYYMKPKMLGGGNKTFEALTFKNLAFGGTLSNDDKTATNDNGSYVLSGTEAGSTTLTVTAHPSSCDGYTAASPTCTGTDILYAEVEANDMKWTTSN